MPIALVLAAAAAAVLAGATVSVRLVPIAFKVALFHAFVLGLPAFLVLRSKRPVTWFVCVVAGFAIGAVPTGLWTVLASLGQAYAPSGDALGGLRFTSTLGAYGAVAGLVFWLSLRLMGDSAAARSRSSEHTGPVPRRAPSWRVLGGLSLAAAASVSALVVPSWLVDLAKDRSCHNPLRDGRQSISPVISPFLRISDEEWTEFVGVFEAFATARGWLVRRPAESGLGRVQVSICDPAGTLVQALRLGAPGGGPGVRITVYQPQGGASWQAPVRDLLAQFSARWPGQVGFTDGRGYETSRPSWLPP